MPSSKSLLHISSLALIATQISLFTILTTLPVSGKIAEAIFPDTGVAFFKLAVSASLKKA